MEKEKRKEKSTSADKFIVKECYNGKKILRDIVVKLICSAYNKENAGG
ncbi:MAG: hypothetical protein FWC80_00350 [Firmicutes bacterium]|nr:hypothetical protein [Bacillota bacterium]